MLLQLDEDIKVFFFSVQVQVAWRKWYCPLCFSCLQENCVSWRKEFLPNALFCTEFFATLLVVALAFRVHHCLPLFPQLSFKTKVFLVMLLVFFCPCHYLSGGYHLSNLSLQKHLLKFFSSRIPVGKWSSLLSLRTALPCEGVENI